MEKLLPTMHTDSYIYIYQTTLVSSHHLKEFLPEIPEYLEDYGPPLPSPPIPTSAKCNL